MCDNYCCSKSTLTFTHASTLSHTHTYANKKFSHTQRTTTTNLKNKNITARTLKNISLCWFWFVLSLFVPLACLSFFLLYTNSFKCRMRRRDEGEKKGFGVSVYSAVENFFLIGLTVFFLDGLLLYTTIFPVKCYRSKLSFAYQPNNSYYITFLIFIISFFSLSNSTN